MPDQYDDATLRKLLEEEGVNWDDQSQVFQKRRNSIENVNESSFLPTSLPGPASILALAVEFGFNIPWGKVVRYLLCVLHGIWTQPLPDAAKECAAKWGDPIDAAQKK
jgi:hypothetical protein